MINVVTKSGTNQLQGSVFEFFRDKALNANNAINELNNRPKSPYHYHQFGGTLGGPIRRSRDFFFFNYDGQRNTQPNIVFLNLPASTPSDPLTLAAIERLRPLAESWNRTLDQDVFLLKTDHQVTGAHRLTLRYNQQNFTGEGFESGGAQNSLEHTGASLVRTRSFNASLATLLGATLFNEARFQYARDSEPGEANSENPEAVIQQGGVTVLTIGRNNFSPRETTIDRWQFADTVTWIRGAHKLKGGFDIQADDILNRFPGFFSGSYTFRTLASFAGGRPNAPTESYQQNFEGAGTTGPVTHPNIREYSIFVQDEWRPRRDVTVNAGLRYDLMKTDPPPVRNPDAQLASADIDTARFNSDTNNWGPRLGIAWSPQGGRYVARGGWGLFYGRTPSIMLGTAHSNNGVNIVSLTFTGDAVPTYPQKFGQIPAGGTAVRPSIFYIDKDFANARLMQANAAFEWEVVSGTSLAVTYLFVDGSQLPRSIDRNLGTLGARTFTVSATGATVSYPFFSTQDRRFANFQRVIAFESTAESRYNGLTLELNRRHANNLQFRAAYTLGKVEDTVPDATAVVPGNAGDDLQVRVESGGLRRRSDRREQRSTSPPRAERRLHDRGARGRPDRVHAGARQRLVLQRDPDRAVGAALHRARGRRRSERGRQHAQRHRPRHGAQSVPPAGPGHLRSADRPRHPVGPGTRAADLGGVQSLQPRQLHRRGHDVLRRDRHDPDARHDVRPPADQRRRAHHADRDQSAVLSRACRVCAL